MIAAKAVNHIGIAVKSIAAHREFYERTLGARFDGIEEIPTQKVRVAFFRIGPAGHEVRLELVEAMGPDSPVAAFIEKRGEGLHHVAYTVEGIDTILESLKSEGIRLIDEQARDGAHHQRIAFVHPKSSSGVLTELCEPPSVSKES
jgi:methylmalonyl-CoA/ethylmalonyl-CoA epimerase